MPITSYFTMNGEIVGEQTTGGLQLDYVPDALGSVIATTDQNQVVQYSARYKPYGDTLVSTGTAPRFTWVGGAGYLASAGQPYCQFSVRDRFYSATEGRWIGVDSFWPTLPSYAYVGNSPVTDIDFSGMIANCRKCSAKPPSYIGKRAVLPCDNHNPNQIGWFKKFDVWCVKHVCAKGLVYYSEIAQASGDCSPGKANVSCPHGTCSPGLSS